MKAIKILTAASLSIICSTTLMGQNSEATKEKAPADQQTQNIHLKTKAIKVYGNCGMCKKRIEKAANSMHGVKSASWNVKTKMLTVQYYENERSKGKSMDNLSRMIAGAGHDTKNYKADDKAYKSLPQCCQYERPEKHAMPQHKEGHNHMPYNH